MLKCQKSQLQNTVIGEHTIQQKKLQAQNLLLGVKTIENN